VIPSSDSGWLRADLHVHSCFSPSSPGFRRLGVQDSYSDPVAIYHVAKERGMDLVTITDHDTIDGCLEFLERYPDAPDFFVSEEIECWMPDSGLKLHVGAYGIDERIHRDVQPLRRNACDLAAYLREQGVYFTLNHPFFFFDGRIPVGDYLRQMLASFAAFETRNGAMCRDQNELAEECLRGAAAPGGAPLSFVAGSDAHTLRRVGLTFTEAEGRTREEFLASLRAGRTRIGGAHATAWDIAIEMHGVMLGFCQQRLGSARDDRSGRRQLLASLVGVATLPAAGIPVAAALVQKMSEARRVRAVRGALSGGDLGVAQTVSA
jgi:predicted metal-dependent phosphoesterase TrpH